MNQIIKYAQYCSLESGRIIAQPKGKDPVGKATPWTSESGLILVFCADLDLVVPAKPI